MACTSNDTICSPRGGGLVWATLARQLESLLPVGAQHAGLARSVLSQLLAVGALVAALLLGNGLLGPGGLADAAQLAAERTLSRLVLAVTARTANVDLNLKNGSTKNVFC